MTRRTLLKSVALAPVLRKSATWRIAGQPVSLSIRSVSANTIRIRITGLGGAIPPDDGSLVLPHSEAQLPPGLSVAIGDEDHSIAITDHRTSRVVQILRFSADNGSFSFRLAEAALGLGEGGAQFDRRGVLDEMRSGQGGYKLHTHGGRVPIPWLIGVSGWAMFVHHPYGAFDLRGSEGAFRPDPDHPPIPIDIFIVSAADPKQIMAEYALLTGHPQMPPRWALGYHQSHRTLASADEILAEAAAFREKKLPCDSLIFLGTGFCPSGWNTANGSFSFNPKVFAEPRKLIQQLHEKNFKVSLHVVIWTPELHGRAVSACQVSRFDESDAACHWDAHRKVFSLGVDGWWPDEGDPLDIKSRLVRNRLYYEGPQIDRPNERPFALHRNGYSGMQRYASFLWSGDVFSTWETLRTHIPIAINTGLSGIPLWGTDIGGFVPTKDLTGELYVRWFQFAAFCPLFRSHGRTWKLRLPWGWNTGELGPNEISGYSNGAANPDESELHNSAVEPICRRFLEIRYQLLPYLYSAVRESCDTGLPILRALWLHYPDDGAVVQRGDQYLWGRDILVAPVVEKGAQTRSLYLPAGTWFDFWTHESIAGGREVTRPAALDTMPLFVRAGAILPMDPIRQYTSQRVDHPMVLWIYPGSDGEFMLYEDDGQTFNYRRGEMMFTHIRWRDQDRTLTLELARGSKMLPPLRRHIEVRVASETASYGLVFEGRRIEVRV